MIPKYRAYIIAEKRSLPVEVIHFGLKFVRCLDGDRCTIYQFNEIILEQWTVLYDDTKRYDLTESEREQWMRDGNVPSDWKRREIYEGDKIKGRALNEYLGKKVDVEGRVEYIPGEFIVPGPNEFYLLRDIGMIEVIGTIHDEVNQ